MVYFIGALGPVSNRVAWTQEFEIDDADTGAPVDIAGASIVVEVRDPETGAIVLSATTAGGRISIVDIGVFRLGIPAGDMRTVGAGTYEVGAVITRDGESRQLIIGTLPILDGVVSQ